MIISLYHSTIIAIRSIISLVNAQIKIGQVPVTNVLDVKKLRIINVTLEKCVKYVLNREGIFKHNDFSHEFPAVVKARDFGIRKTKLDGEEKNITEIAEKNFVNLCLLKVKTMKK